MVEFLLKPKSRDKVIKNLVRNRSTSFVLGGIGLSVSSKVVYNQNVLVASGTAFEMDGVDGDYLERSCNDGLEWFTSWECGSFML